MNEQTTPPGVPEHLNPEQMPARFWTAIDFGLMTLEQARSEWATQRDAGAKFDALG
jgi:hypothetical protein